MAAGKARLQKEKREWASAQRLVAAGGDPPPNSVKRLLKRLPGETNLEAAARAELLSWWAWVIDPTPRGDDARYWVWFCDEAVGS